MESVNKPTFCRRLPFDVTEHFFIDKVLKAWKDSEIRKNPLVLQMKRFFS